MWRCTLPCSSAPSGTSSSGRFGIAANSFASSSSAVFAASSSSGIQVLAALDQVVDARVKPGHDESWAARRNDKEKCGPGALLGRIGFRGRAGGRRGGRGLRGRGLLFHHADGDDRALVERQQRYRE